jgi:hypothetical protein
MDSDVLFLGEAFLPVPGAGCGPAVQVPAHGEREAQPLHQARVQALHPEVRRWVGHLHLPLRLGRRQQVFERLPPRCTKVTKKFGDALSLKGQCHEMDIFFWRSKHYNQYFLCMCWWFEVFQKVFTILYSFKLFLFFLWNYLHTNFENAYLNPYQNSLLCDWSMFSNADLSLAAGKMRRTLKQLIIEQFGGSLRGRLKCIRIFCPCTRLESNQAHIRKFMIVQPVKPWVTFWQLSKGSLQYTLIWIHSASCACNFALRDDFNCAIVLRSKVVQPRCPAMDNDMSLNTFSKNVESTVCFV